MNQTLNSTSSVLTPAHYLSRGFDVFEFVAGIVISVLGTIFNVTVIYCLRNHAHGIKNEAATKFVINLALSDLLFSSVTLPISGIGRFFRTTPILSDVLCKVEQVTYYWTFELSLLALSCVTFNR